MKTSRSSAETTQEIIPRLEHRVDLGRLSPQQSLQLVEAFERWLVDQTWARVARKKLKVEIDLTKPGPAIVEDILRAAHEKKISGPVAQHLVGAKLAPPVPWQEHRELSASLHDSARS